MILRGIVQAVRIPVLMAGKCCESSTCAYMFPAWQGMFQLIEQQRLEAVVWCRLVPVSCKCTAFLALWLLALSETCMSANEVTICTKESS